MRRWPTRVGIGALTALWLGAIVVLRHPTEGGTTGAVILGAFVAASVLAVGLLLRWMFRWHDLRWDSRENQARSELWSARIGSGGNS